MSTTQDIERLLKNLENIVQAFRVHLAFHLSCVKQLDSEFFDLGLEKFVLSLELNIFFDDFVDGLSTLSCFSFGLSESDVLLVEQIDQVVLCFCGGFHDEGKKKCLISRMLIQEAEEMSVAVGRGVLERRSEVLTEV